ncbi:MAG: fructose bisphosphate aldolase [Pseudomonadota bacterium]
MNQAQADQMKNGAGFIAALDQSGGSTPKALRLYGIGEDAYANDAEMFDLIHAMRSRIATAPSFTGDKVIGAILFEMTMDREIKGKPAAQYLWENKQVVPFLKVDKGLEETQDDVQVMKPIDGLDATLARAKDLGVFGTKMRSVIHGANGAGIARNVAQQFDIGRQILGHGVMPILEPEVTITIDDKAAAEEILLDAILGQLDALPADEQIMLKLSLPSKANLYAPLIAHPKVMRVVALSGGYSRDAANSLLAQNTGMIASFSRGLAEGLDASQSDAAFNTTLGSAIDAIFEASKAG